MVMDDGNGDFLNVAVKAGITLREYLALLTVTAFKKRYAFNRGGKCMERMR